MVTNKLVSFDSSLEDDLENGEEILAQNVSVRSFLTEEATPSTETPASSLLPTSFTSACSSDRSLESDKASIKETPSVSKILSKLLSRSSNRKCADCRAQLLNSSKTFVSFSPSLDKLPNDSSQRRSIPRFSYNHRVFAPDSTFKGKSNLFQKEIDPAHRVTKLLNGHGVFICKACAKAHTYLGPTITTVKSVQNFSIWNQEEVQFLRKSGSNKSSWLIYEGYIPEKWLRYMPSASSGLEIRLNFIRAKYEALAFVLPSSDSIVACQAWQRILEKDTSLQRFLRPACPLMFLSKLLLINDNGIEDIQSSNDHGMPDRLVDFFCVVSPKMKLHPEERHTDFYDIESPEHLKLEPHVIDCYPEFNAHTDMEFPEHISNFVYPDGCCLSETHQPPTLFTFVLTSATGQRLYCAALRIYDETMETSQVKDILEASDYSVPLPWWLSDVPTPTRNGVSARQPSDIVFVPKSLVVISHFPFFHAFREFLKQLYQLSVMETPLPIERYIANFISEIPLPPRGKVEVKFGFMSVVQFTIFRSAPNELPMAKFSFRPLFTALSISNILVVFGCLLEETKVVLLSKNIGLLTPCAEAFLSFLFPFEWQGIYIPVMPSSLLEVLEAPVPFLVGLHSRYLKEVKVQNRSKGVVLVDLDNDIVHLGFCESMHNDGFHDKRLPPSLPEKVSMKLRNKLQGCASCQYVPPGNGIKGSITYGDAEQLPNGLREPYAHIEPFHAAPDDDSRSEILEESDQAYALDDGLSTTQGFFSENGQLAAKMPNKPDEKSVAKPKLFTKLKAKIDRRQNSQLSSSDGNTSNSSINWLDLHDLNEKVGSFNVSQIRNAFLRFFTATFNGYDKFIKKSRNGDLFNDNDFIDEKSATPAQKNWLSQVLKTQLFQRFLEIRLEDPNDASVLFFDESVIAKNNRSVKKSLKQGKITTPFLDNPSWKISDVFTPPAPSNWGLPADGRLYSYSRFPKLNKSLYGTARMKKRWPPEWEQKVERKLGMNRALTMKRNAMLQSAYMSARSQALMSKLNSANGEFVPTLLTNQGRNPRERNLSWAIRMLTDKNVEESIRDDMDDITSNSSLRSQHNERLATRSENQNIAAETIILAQEILLASRRKQGILLSIVVEFQRRAISLARKPASQTQSVTLPCIEYPVKTSQIVAIQKRVRGFVILQRYKKKITSAICIQKNYRHRRQLLLIKRIKGITLLQSWWRGVISRRRAMKRASSIKKLQALLRGAAARFAYGMVINEVIRIQAHVRAYLVRRYSLSLLQQLSARYRDQIFYLWIRSHAPLSYRTQMWSLFQASFLGIRIMNGELERLWTMLEIQGESNQSLSKDSFLQKLESRGFSTRFEQKFVNMSYVIMNVRDQSSNMEFPGEKSSVGIKQANRIATERLQIYERLNKLSKPDSEAIYELFGISPKSKKKKLHTLGKLWESPLFTDESTNLMLTLFPELKESTDIKQVMASRKGLNRFHSSQKHSLLDPLDREFCVAQKLDTLFRKNMTEVALASLRRIPARSTPLTKSRSAMRMSSQFNSRTKDERVMRRATMKKFLYSDYDHVTSSLSEWS